jgi:4-amino-4-deoxy-L-arabinose transferase-like glycosyltransferase
MKAQRWVWLGLAATTLLHLFLAARLPVADDEAYYRLWASHLAWGYPDHPPLIAALLAGSIRLFGDGPFGLRGLTMLLMSSLPLLLYLGGRDLFDRATGWRAAGILMVLPYVAVTVGAYPDVPLLVFWALGLWTGWHALHRGGWWWIAAAAAVGLALLSKLTAVFLLAGLAMTWITGPWRRSLRDPFWYAGLALGAGMLLPVVQWNTMHNWEMLRTAVYGPPLPVVRSLGENLLVVLGGQFLYFGPIALLLIWAVVTAAGRWRAPAWRLLASTSVPLSLSLVFAAFNGIGKPHWPVPAYLAAVIGAAALWPEWRRLKSGLAGLAGATLSLIAAAVILFLAPGGLDLREYMGRWDRVADAASREAERRNAFILTSSYESASQIAYHLRQRVPVTSPAGAFPLWHRSEETAGRKMVYVEDRLNRPGRSFLSLCAAPRSIGSIEIGPAYRTATLLRREEVKGVAVLYACERFLGFPTERAF